MTNKNTQELSEYLATQACQEYIAMASNSPRHPLHRELDGLTPAELGEMTLFAQDIAELVGFALADPECDARGQVAAQSARRMLDCHPTWTRMASDWASSAGLGQTQIDTLSNWLD